MASTPTFASAPVLLKGDVSTANANRDGTGTVVTLTDAAGASAAPAAGRRIEQIVVKSTGDPADSIMTLFLHDGTNFHLYDEIDMGNPAAGSTTVESFRAERTYRFLVLPSGWSLRAAVTVAPTSGVLKVLAFGAELT
jgi:hypothetical protein